MKYMLPILALGVAAILMAASTAEEKSQTVSEKQVSDTTSRQPGAHIAPPATPLPNGQELVDQAAQQLLVMPGIEAKTRQRVHLFDQELIGSGSYLQLARGPRLMLRLDLKLQLGDRVASLLQISDGDFLWIRRDLAHQKSLGRVNLRKLRAAASQAEVPIPASFWMALGGMPQLLIRLNEHFEFQTPRATSIGELPVWQLEGRWRTRQLVKLLPEQRSAIEAGEDPDLGKLPAHQPHGVTVILGRDQVIPLFPYGVSFYRNEPRPEEQGRGVMQRRPLVTLELFEVRFRSDLTPDNFQYRPGDQEIEEQTDQFVARLDAAAHAHK